MITQLDGSLVMTEVRSRAQLFIPIRFRNAYGIFRREQKNY